MLPSTALAIVLGGCLAGLRSDRNADAAGGHGVMQTKLGDHVVAFTLP